MKIDCQCFPLHFSFWFVTEGNQNLLIMLYDFQARIPVSSLLLAFHLSNSAPAKSHPFDTLIVFFMPHGTIKTKQNI